MVLVITDIYTGDHLLSTFAPSDEPSTGHSALVSSLILLANGRAESAHSQGGPFCQDPFHTVELSSNVKGNIWSQPHDSVVDGLHRHVLTPADIQEK